MPSDEISCPINVIFNRDNFAQWSQAMRSYLKGRKLWLYVSGDRLIPEQVDKETDSAYAIQIEDWESVNHQIITWFCNTSISSIVDEFSNIDIAKEVWDLLFTRYAGPIGARNFKLTRELYQIRQEPGERIIVYHSRLKSILDQLIASEPVLSNSTDTKLVYVHREQGRLFQFLMGLRYEFELARSHILHQDPLPTISQAIHKLVDNETRLQTEPSSIQTMVLATPATVSQTVTPIFPSVSSPTSVSKRKGNNVRRHNNKKSLLICSFCKNKGHSVETCYTRQHILQNTAALTQSESSAMDSHSKSGPASSLSIADLHDMVNQVHLPSSSASNTALSTISGTSPMWLLDSACCNHMTSAPDVVPSHTSTSLPTIYTTNGSPMHVSHLGNVSTPALSVSNVYQIPKLTHNLLSVEKLTELGFFLTFSSTVVVVRDSQTGQIVGTSRKVGRLFELIFLHLPSSRLSASAISEQSTSSLVLWHSRLGHASISRVKQLVSRGLLGSVSNKSFDCMPCQFGKQNALPFNNNVSHTLSSFDLIHSNV